MYKLPGFERSEFYFLPPNSSRDLKTGWLLIKIVVACSVRSVWVRDNQQTGRKMLGKTEWKNKPQCLGLNELFREREIFRNAKQSYAVLLLRPIQNKSINNAENKRHLILSVYISCRLS
jgi:hypothetical protein